MVCIPHPQGPGMIFLRAEKVSGPLAGLEQGYVLTLDMLWKCSPQVLSGSQAPNLTLQLYFLALPASTLSRYGLWNSVAKIGLWNLLSKIGIVELALQNCMSRVLPENSPNLLYYHYSRVDTCLCTRFSFSR